MVVLIDPGMLSRILYLIKEWDNYLLLKPQVGPSCMNVRKA